MSLAVVIPTLNEVQSLPLLLTDLDALAGVGSLDIIVSDGGSTDGTIGFAASVGAQLVRAPRGRALQLNAGARAARRDWLLFLHADCRLDAEARRALRAALEPSAGVQAAVFRFAIDLPTFWRRVIEAGQGIREGLSGLAYGDQGLLVRRELFESIGGYPDLPLMEDVAMIRRLRGETAVRRLPAKLLTSGRRYVRDGVARTWLKHMALITLYSAGVSPHRLARLRDG